MKFVSGVPSQTSEPFFPIVNPMYLRAYVVKYDESVPLIVYQSAN